jgi:hypothetical protein
LNLTYLNLQKNGLKLLEESDGWDINISFSRIVVARYLIKIPFLRGGFFFYTIGDNPNPF